MSWPWPASLQHLKPLHSGLYSRTQRPYTPTYIEEQHCWRSPVALSRVIHIQWPFPFPTHPQTQRMHADACRVLTPALHYRNRGKLLLRYSLVTNPLPGETLPHYPIFDTNGRKHNAASEHNAPPLCHSSIVTEKRSADSGEEVKNGLRVQ